MSFEHGLNAVTIPSQPVFAPLGADIFPVYIGTAPINIVGTSETNTLVYAASFPEVKAKLGYSDDWANFTLCEAMSAHFNNPEGNVGPICLINVLDLATAKKVGSASITFASKVAYVNKENVILTSCAITGKVKGTDFTVEYVELNGVNQVKITDIGGVAMTTVTLNFDEIDFTLVTGTEIIGSRTNDTRKGLELVDMVYQEIGSIPNVLSAPGWNHLPTVYAALASKAQKINGHWDADVFVDIEASTTTTKAAAITWKSTNGYTGKHFVGWPMVQYGTKKYHMSTLAIAMMQKVALANGGVPYESVSNKAVPFTKLILANGTKVTLDEVDANALNAVGISTVTYVGGAWVLWGPHAGNYSYANESNIKAEDMFLATISMQKYLSNNFQKKYTSKIDGPLNRRNIEAILGDAQKDINDLIHDGALLAGTIQFVESSNPISSLITGAFRFDISYTSVPVAKSGTFAIQYSPSGLAELF